MLGEYYIHCAPNIDNDMIDRIESAFAGAGYLVKDYPLYDDSIADFIGARFARLKGKGVDLDNSDFWLSGRPNKLYLGFNSTLYEDPEFFTTIYDVLDKHGIAHTTEELA